MTLNTADQSQGFLFADTIGLGLNVSISRGSAIDINYRFRHLSNAGIREPNYGIEHHIGLISCSLFYRGVKQLALRKDLLEILACPKCRETFVSTRRATASFATTAGFSMKSGMISPSCSSTKPKSSIDRGRIGQPAWAGCFPFHG